MGPDVPRVLADRERERQRERKEKTTAQNRCFPPLSHPPILSAEREVTSKASPESQRVTSCAGRTHDLTCWQPVSHKLCVTRWSYLRTGCDDKSKVDAEAKRGIFPPNFCWTNPCEKVEFILFERVRCFWFGKRDTRVCTHARDQSHGAHTPLLAVCCVCSAAGSLSLVYSFCYIVYSSVLHRMISYWHCHIIMENNDANGRCMGEGSNGNFALLPLDVQRRMKEMPPLQFSVHDSAALLQHQQQQQPQQQQRMQPTQMQMQQTKPVASMCIDA